MSNDSNLTPDEIQFTNAFNAQRVVLAGFARCSSKEELHIVRDAFFIGLASDLRLQEYEAVREAIITNNAVAKAASSKNTFQATVEAARKANDGFEDGRNINAWDYMVIALKARAMSVSSDLDEIWMTLENGRLEWLAAASGAHRMKTLLKGALENQCGGVPTEGDISDAKMVWMYALSLSIPSLKNLAETWQKLVEMPDKLLPLIGYKAELWDCRKSEWASIDRGVQAAAERGGSTLEEAWNL